MTLRDLLIVLLFTVLGGWCGYLTKKLSNSLRERAIILQHYRSLSRKDIKALIDGFNVMLASSKKFSNGLCYLNRVLFMENYYDENTRALIDNYIKKLAFLTNGRKYGSYAFPAYYWNQRETWLVAQIELLQEYLLLEDDKI